MFNVDSFPILGLSDTLAEQLTNGLPADALQSFVELYCNFWRKLPRLCRPRVTSTLTPILHAQPSSRKCSAPNSPRHSLQCLATREGSLLLNWRRTGLKKT